MGSEVPGGNGRIDRVHSRHGPDPSAGFAISNLLGVEHALNALGFVWLSALDQSVIARTTLDEAWTRLKGKSALKPTYSTGAQPELPGDFQHPRTFLQFGTC